MAAVLAPPVNITIELSQQSYTVLCALQQTGKFGATVDGAAAEMLRHRLRELELEGWLPQTLAFDR